MKALKLALYSIYTQISITIHTRTQKKRGHIHLICMYDVPVITYCCNILAKRIPSYPLDILLTFFQCADLCTYKQQKKKKVGILDNLQISEWMAPIYNPQSISTSEFCSTLSPRLADTTIYNYFINLKVAYLL